MSRHTTPKLSKRKKKQVEGQETEIVKFNFHLNNIQPLTDAQSDTWDAFYSDKNLLLHGMAGTGKSFISLYLALKELIEEKQYRKIVIVRSVVPTRDMGFLPGSVAEKIKIYEDPYRQIFTELFGRGDAYDYLKTKHVVEFIPTSHIRGITINDSIVVVDEMQNMTFHELDSVITRSGDNCRLVFCGDLKQSDLLKDFEKKGLKDFMSIIKTMKQFTSIEFTANDIVRSALVKEYILSKDHLGL